MVTIDKAMPEHIEGAHGLEVGDAIVSKHTSLFPLK